MRLGRGLIGATDKQGSEGFSMLLHLPNSAAHFDQVLDGTSVVRPLEGRFHVVIHAVEALTQQGAGLVPPTNPSRTSIY